MSKIKEANKEMLDDLVHCRPFFAPAWANGALFLVSKDRVRKVAEKVVVKYRLSTTTAGKRIMVLLP